MKVLTVVTKNGVTKEFPLSGDNIKISTSFEDLKYYSILYEDVNFICIDPSEIVLIAIFEYPEAIPGDDTTNYDVDPGPTL